MHSKLEDANAPQGVGAVSVSPYLNETDKIPDDIIGSEILKIGKPENSRGFMSGGFVIEYKTKTGEIKRLLLGHDEYCLWIIDHTNS